ncbi:MAG: CDP-alcohol phosphatidyltransferase family protein [Deltaproteobacteria bacterium]|nr:CDP-alcohol phosphatidyltransferase family protein [Deltaproteobacteria bacterium]
MYIAVQILTVVRIPLAILFAFVLLNSQKSTTTLCFCAVLLVIGEMTDLFDGILARRSKTVSEWGAMLDPYADSISRLIVYWTLAVASLASPIVPLTMAFRDVTVAYSRIVLTRYGVSVAAKWSGKIKAGFQGIGAYVILMGPVYWQWTGEWTIPVFSWIIILVTLGSMVEYIKASFKAVQKSKLNRLG